MVGHPDGHPENPASVIAHAAHLNEVEWTSLFLPVLGILYAKRPGKLEYTLHGNSDVPPTPVCRFWYSLDKMWIMDVIQ